MSENKTDVLEQQSLSSEKGIDRRSVLRGLLSSGKGAALAGAALYAESQGWLEKLGFHSPEIPEPTNWEGEIPEDASEAELEAEAQKILVELQQMIQPMHEYLQSKEAQEIAALKGLDLDKIGSMYDTGIDQVVLFRTEEQGKALEEMVQKIQTIQSQMQIANADLSEMMNDIKEDTGRLVDQLPTEERHRDGMEQVITFVQDDVEKLKLELAALKSEHDTNLQENLDQTELLKNISTLGSRLEELTKRLDSELERNTNVNEGQDLMLETLKTAVESMQMALGFMQKQIEGMHSRMASMDKKLDTLLGYHGVHE